MDGLLEKKAYKDIVFDWATSHGFTPVESEINDLLWRLEKIVSGEASLTAPNPQPVWIGVDIASEEISIDADGNRTVRKIQPVSAALEALERFNELVKLQKTKKDAYNAHNILLYDRTRNTIDVLFQKLLKDHRDTIKQALAQAGGQDDECFDIGDMVQISPNNPYYEDWKGVTLEIVGIYRDRGSKYQSPNTPPPIRYSVKDVKDGWTYGYTDDFSFEDLVAAPVSAKEG